MRRTDVGAVFLVAAALTTVPSFAQTDGAFPPDLRAGFDRIAREVLAKTVDPGIVGSVETDNQVFVKRLFW